MSGKIPSGWAYTRQAGEQIAMDTLIYLGTGGKVFTANPGTDVDFVALSAGPLDALISCDPQPSVANLTAVGAITAADIVIAAPAGGVAKWGGSAGRTVTVANATEIWTSVAHGFVTGQVVRLTNAGGALPAGSAANTSYYVRKIDADTFYLYTSIAGALAGGATDMLLVSGDGTGTQTARPYGVVILVGKANETAVDGQKTSVLFDKRRIELA
jgi:hypothetical protein